MKKRKLIALLMIVAAALFVFAGCGKKSDETTKATESKDAAAETKSSEKDYVGTWEAKEDNESLTLTLASDGTFKMINTETDDGVTESATASGTYVVDGNTIKLTTENVTADDRTDNGDDVVSELQDQMNITATYTVKDAKLTLTASEGTPYIIDEETTVTFTKA